MFAVYPNVREPSFASLRFFAIAGQLLTEKIEDKISLRDTSAFLEHVPDPTKKYGYDGRDNPSIRYIVSRGPESSWLMFQGQKVSYPETSVIGNINAPSDGTPQPLSCYLTH